MAALRPVPLAPRNGDWANVLEPDERLLWQGKPAPGFRLTPRQAMLALVGLVLIGLSALLAAQGAAGLRSGDPAAGGAVAFSAAGALLGLWCAVWPGVSDLLRRRGTAYALTDRRALVETDFMGYGLVAWPLGPQSPILRGTGRRQATIWFALYRPPDRALLLRASGRMSGPRPVGFEHVREPDKVLALLETVCARA